MATGSRQKKIGYLAIFGDGRHIFRFKDKFNPDSLVESASEAMRKHEKALMIVDGAKQHFSNKVEEFVLRQNGNLVVWPPPPASPHMSCVEKGGSIGRGAAEAVRSCTSFEEKIAGVSKFFGTNRLRLNLVGHLGRRIGPGRCI